MIGGGFHVSFFTVARALLLGFHKEKQAIGDPVEREKYYKAKVAELYTNGKAVAVTSVLEIDEVIDLAESCRWVMAGLQSVPEIALSPQAALHRCLIGYREHVRYNQRSTTAFGAKRKFAKALTSSKVPRAT